MFLWSHLIFNLCAKTHFMKENLEAVLKVFGIIGGLAAALLFFKKEWKSYAIRRNSFYNGNWNNQGQIITIPSHYLDIDGSAIGNRFIGRFNVRKGDNPNSWETFSISGKIRFGKIFCKIIKVINGSELVVANGFLRKRK